MTTMLMSPIKVYLDSSDYSVLSNPCLVDDKLVSMLDQLRRWVADGKIICLYSGTHLSEMAPLDAVYAEAAERRANLLVELCGRNALVSQDRLIAGELKFALGLIEERPLEISTVGEWYPDGIGSVFSSEAIKISSEIKQSISEVCGNRKTRRMAERMALKRGKPRAQVHAAIVANSRTGSLDEVLQKIPMRSSDARVLARYIAGDASADEANDAFQESLRDPRWMMQWFRNHHDELSPFIDWVRKPGRSVLISLDEMATFAKSVRASDEILGTTLSEDLFSSAKWLKWQNNLLESVATRLANELALQLESQLMSDQIDAGCPGLSTGTRALHSAWYSLVSARPRQAKLSDFPDAMHAMYAPYVDIFRADSFMAPHVGRFSQRFQTKVVPKLSTLVPAIQEALAIRELKSTSMRININANKNC